MSVTSNMWDTLQTYIVKQRFTIVEIRPLLVDKIKDASNGSPCTRGNCNILSVTDEHNYDMQCRAYQVHKSDNIYLPNNTNLRWITSVLSCTAINTGTSIFTTVPPFISRFIASPIVAAAVCWNSILGRIIIYVYTYVLLV